MEGARENIRDVVARSEEKLCECDRPDLSDDPHRHEKDMACIYWLAGRPSQQRLVMAFEGELPLTAPVKYHGKQLNQFVNSDAPDGLTGFGRRVQRLRERFKQ